MAENRKTANRDCPRSSIPEGLEKCFICGEYKGRVTCKDLNWKHIQFTGGDVYSTCYSRIDKTANTLRIKV